MSYRVFEDLLLFVLMSDESKVFYLELVFLLFGFVIAYTICYHSLFVDVFLGLAAVFIPNIIFFYSLQ